MIPKKIHYCWFGGKELPELAKKCMHSWRTVWADYEIVCWNESNCIKNQYINNALKMKKFANASNLMRFYALLEGGIYLDIDIEAVKDFGDVLNKDFFAGWQDSKLINNAVMGAQPNHFFIKLCIKEFENTFNASERANISSPNFVTKMINDNNIDSKCILPYDYFYPFSWARKPPIDYGVTDNTICIHHWMKSWK